MICPYCRTEETKVVDTRLKSKDQRRRRYECEKCLRRFTTYENYSRKVLKEVFAMRLKGEL